jgi:hypothetical protein
MSFLGNFCYAVKPLVPVHCTKISEFFEFVCYFFEFLYSTRASTPGIRNGLSSRVRATHYHSYESFFFNDVSLIQSIVGCIMLSAMTGVYNALRFYARSP